jgi:hypothetical protein
MTILKPRNPAAKENAANGEVSPSAVSQNLTRCSSLSPKSVPRFEDLPKVDVILLDRKDLEPAGAGETPII